MAKQGSFIRNKGNLGGLSFYESNGQALVRETGGVAKSRILHDNAFKRTRENMSEFGGSASIGKALRSCFISISKLFSSKFLAGRITKIMKQINSKGTGTRGKRSFEIVANKYSLVGFEFNQQKHFDSLFLAPYTLVANNEKNRVDLVVPAFNTSDFINAPQGATHFRLIIAIGVLSDYLFDDETGKYEPANPDQNMLNNAVYTSEIQIGGMMSNPINIQCNLDGAPTLDGTAALIACMGIEFLQQMDGQFYSLKSDNALKIKNVF